MSKSGKVENPYMKYVKAIKKSMITCATCVQELIDHFTISISELDATLARIEASKQNLDETQFQLIEGRTLLVTVREAANILRGIFKDTLRYGNLSSEQRGIIEKDVENRNYDSLNDYLDTLHTYFAQFADAYEEFENKKNEAVRLYDENIRKCRKEGDEASNEGAKLRRSGEQKENLGLMAKWGGAAAAVSVGSAAMVLGAPLFGMFAVPAMCAVAIQGHMACNDGQAQIAAAKQFDEIKKEYREISTSISRLHKEVASIGTEVAILNRQTKALKLKSETVMSKAVKVQYYSFKATFDTLLGGIREAREKLGTQ